MLRNELTFPKESCLNRLSQHSWEVLSSAWTVSHYQSGQFLISADDNDKDVFFVLRGAAKATIYTPGGREVAFVALNVGDCFGEFSAIDDAPRSASVVASGECLAARISSEAFRAILKSQPDITFIFLTILVRHLRDLNKRVVDLNTKSADKRLREALLDLAVKSAGSKDETLVHRPPTQSELASFIFSSRESVAREMGRMRQAGVLGREKRSLFFPSIKKLRAYADQK
jgi:CRP/FNR family transcriptional regulator, cyclic AMP receptor protein